MKRKVIHIDEELCDGCGLCVPSCQEGALRIIDGKARLVSEVYCDGLGACLGECPQGAISMIEREAEAFDEKAVEQHLQKQSQVKEMMMKAKSSCAGSCPGSKVMTLEPVQTKKPSSLNKPDDSPRPSQLRQWPVQLHLLPVQAPHYANSDLLIAADCVSFAMANFHETLLKDHTLAIACPKLDDTGPYIEKLSAIFSSNSIQSITVAIMEVPCCQGLLRMVEQARQLSGVEIPLKVKVISIRGEIKH